MRKVSGTCGEISLGISLNSDSIVRLAVSQGHLAKNMRPMRLFFLLLVMARCDDAPLTLTIRSPDDSGALVPQTAFSFNISSDFDDLQELADDYMQRQPTVWRGSNCGDAHVRR